jgi:hypothetical protein
MNVERFEPHPRAGVQHNRVGAGCTKVQEVNDEIGCERNERCRAHYRHCANLVHALAKEEATQHHQWDNYEVYENIREYHNYY